MRRMNTGEYNRSGGREKETRGKKKKDSVEGLILRLANQSATKPRRWGSSPPLTTRSHFFSSSSSSSSSCTTNMPTYTCTCIIPDYVHTHPQLVHPHALALITCTFHLYTRLNIPPSLGGTMARLAHCAASTLPITHEQFRRRDWYSPPLARNPKGKPRRLRGFVALGVTDHAGPRMGEGPRLRSSISSCSPGLQSRDAARNEELNLSATICPSCPLLAMTCHPRWLYIRSAATSP
ncbi:hypothetical protein GGS23DRAFT_547455 [Durotheca rogersii]|uniref:uncharacterized protein n=1 Tax=Durotheca rogersii TaxID=419775 RepID=UPI00221FDD3C|nr:uncharacterized protein GGS23DRAFT_547455 [Durotheca rogersii]KAI5867233.1 hypothetical protein GGS23DRAFT_547455 [Durotheca rogersii]